jgi:hypothetical protein
MEVQERTKKQDQVETSAVKEKMKTRGAAQPPQQDNAAQATDIPQRLLPDRQPRFAVGKRALKVFSMLFLRRTKQMSQARSRGWTALTRWYQLDFPPKCSTALLGNSTLSD